MKYLGFVLLVLSGYVMAEEVYYCSDSVNEVGYDKKNGNYGIAFYSPAKFKMKLQDDGDIVISIDGDNKLYLCWSLGGSFGGTEHKNHKLCVHETHNGWYFNLNLDNGRYVGFNGFGYVFGDGDSVSTRIGTCTKF